MAENNLYVHFDYSVPSDNTLYLGVIIKDDEDGEILESGLKKFDISRRQGNNFHYSISAFGFAIQYVHNYLLSEGLTSEFDTLYFGNQNRHIFKWFQTDSYSDSYAKAMENVKASYEALMDDIEFECAFCMIKGTKNHAKTFLKKNPQIKQVSHTAKEIKHLQIIREQVKTDRMNAFFFNDVQDIENLADLEAAILDFNTTE